MNMMEKFIAYLMGEGEERIKESRIHIDKTRDGKYRGSVDLSEYDEDGDCVDSWNEVHVYRGLLFKREFGNWTLVQYETDEFDTEEELRAMALEILEKHGLDEYYTYVRSIYED